MSLDYDAFYHARMERCAYLSVAVFLGYEHLLQLGDEFELFWQKRWSFGKCLFLWSRYYSLGFNIANAIMFMNEHPSLDVSTKFFHWQNTGAALQVITTHIILELRIYAMYGSTRGMLALCAALTVAEACVYGVVFGVPKAGLVSTNTPAPGLFICADADAPHAHWITWFWLTAIAVEGVLLGLAVRQGWQARRAGLRGGLTAALARDSVLYFVVIFCVYAVNMALWFRNTITLDEFGTGFSFAVSAVLANRLLLAVRTTYYARRAEWDTFSSMRFQSGAGSASTFGGASAFGGESLSGGWDECAGAEEYEMDDFSEARGF